MYQAKVYVQTVAATAVLADANLVAGARPALLFHVKVSGQGARTAGSITIEDLAGVVLHSIEVGAGTYINLHEEFGTPIKSSNGLKVNFDGTLTGPLVVTIGYQ